MWKTGMVALLALGACATDGTDGTNGTNGSNGSNGTNGMNGMDGAPGMQGPAGPQLALPAVYTLSNAAAGNEVAAFTRASNGNLSRKGRFSTGGTGSGSGPGSQGAIIFDARSQRFFAVNFGDNTLSMLAIGGDGALTALSTVPSGGVHPASVAVSGSTVYVANQGNMGNATVDANISGFKIEGDALVAIAGSTQPLSATSDVRPTDIRFSPDGKLLLVAERLASKLDTFVVEDGVAQAGTFHPSAGQQPFAHRGGQPLADRERCIRQSFPELARQRHRHHARNGRRQADGDASGGRSPHPAEIFPGTLDLVQNATTMFEQELAGLGRRRAAAIAHQ